MVRQIYAVYDRTAKDIHGGALLLVANEAVAIRDFAEAVMTPNSMFARHADDYCLIGLGGVVTVDGEDGRLEEEVRNVATTTRLVITARQVLAAQPKTEGQGA